MWRWKQAVDVGEGGVDGLLLDRDWCSVVGRDLALVLLRAHG